MEHPVAKSSNNSKLIPLVIVIILVAIGGFVGGMQYQKGKAGTTTASTSQAGGFGSGNGQMRQMNGGFGSVTAVTATSITVSEQRQGTSKTYTISDSTKITDGSTAATYSDIAVGDQVLVQTSSSTSTDATSIQLNPTMGGPGGAGGGAPSSSTSTDSTTTQTN